MHSGAHSKARKNNRVSCQETLCIQTYEKWGCASPVPPFPIRPLELHLGKAHTNLIKVNVNCTCDNMESIIVDCYLL